MESQNNFFASEQFQGAVKKFLKKFNSAQEGTEFEKTRNQHINLILSTMPREAALWDKHCSINIEWIGSSFISRLSDEKDILSKENIDDVFSICYRFLFELYLSMKDKLSMEFETVRKFAWDNVDKFEDSAKRQIEFAIRDMPIAILKSLISHDNIESIKEFNKTSEKANRMRDEWNHDLDDRTAKVAALKDNLDKYKAAFNFVGLHQGFDDLVTAKIKEKNYVLLFLIVFGLLTVSPLITEVVYIYKSGKSLSDFKDIFLVALVPTISLVAILIYFFRILLFNFNALKSQILQLELRKTLCRFIQNYVEYSTVIKQKDKDSLTKFENIVFSGIVSDDAKLPSTFDGVEQLANLIKSIKA
jgi:hypothetical protein